MKYVLPLVAVAAAAVVSGCMDQRTYMDPNQNASFGGGGPQSNMTLANGRLKGDFGPRTGFDGDATDMQGTSDPEWRTSTVTVARSEQTRGTGMVIIWTNGITLENLDVGAHNYTYDPESIDAAPVTMNACSGADSASIDYDRPVNNVTATVQDTPEGRQYQFHTSTPKLDDSGNEVAGELETSDTTFILNPQG
jgi:hypothetical protein